MSSFQRLAVHAQLAATGLVDRAFARIGDREAGQSSAEYAGIIIVAIVLVGVLVKAADTWGGTIRDLITKKIGEIGI